MNAPEIFNFTIWTDPIGKPRMTRRDKWLDPPRPAVAKWRRFRDHVFFVAWQEGFRRGDRILELDFKAYFTMPRSWSKKKKADNRDRPHLSVPDRDNIDKAILDALQTNDAACWKGSQEKRWDDGEGARIEIRIRIAPEV